MEPKGDHNLTSEGPPVPSKPDVARSHHFLIPPTRLFLPSCQQTQSVHQLTAAAGQYRMLSGLAAVCQGQDITREAAGDGAVEAVTKDSDASLSHPSPCQILSHPLGRKAKEVTPTELFFISREIE